jgi:hypothetical protein
VVAAGAAESVAGAAAVAAVPGLVCG